jgi:hypothetical protein
MNPFMFWGLPLFSLKIFFDELLCIFWGCLFFIRYLFYEPMNERSEGTPLFVALLVCAKALVECQANLVSYFDLALS